MTDHLQYWVEGTGIARSTDAQKHAALEHVRALARGLGLSLHTTIFHEGITPTGAPRRRWTHKRVPLSDLYTDIEMFPGITVYTLARSAYADPDNPPPEPWVGLEADAALQKTRNAVQRLVARASIIKRYDRAGLLHLFTAGHPAANDYSTNPSGRGSRF